MGNLYIEHIAIGEIMSYAKNAKNHPEHQVQQIARSIKEFGFNNPILVDDKNEIVAGHGRLMAAQIVGLDTVPVIRLAHLSETQKRAYRLADNKIAENGGWNEDILKLELSELEAICDFDIQLSGFSTLEIDVKLDEKSDKNKVDEKGNAVPFIPDNEIVSQPGDLWLIGNHRLLCGSSLEESNFEKLMDGKLADIVSDDPPYNLSANTIGSSGKIKHKDFKMGGGEMSQEEFTKFLTTNFALCSKYAKPTALAYKWMDFRHIREIMDAGESSFGRLLNLCVWSKPIGGMGSFYRSRHELCFIFSNGDKSYTNNIELGKHGRYRTNIWECGSVNCFGHHKDDLKFHSTVKPYEMIADIFLDASPRGGIVLDTFMGSGTSLIAAEKVKRICYGIEIEPLYVDTAIRRFHDLFGIDAIHEQSGRIYSELLAQKKGAE